MPHVALAPATRESRLAAAAARWDAIRTSQPDLEPAVALQSVLVSLVIDLAEAVDRNPPPRLSLPPKYLSAKLARGVPALAGEPIPIPTPMLTPTLLKLCEALSKGGAGEAADHVHSLIVEGRLEAGSLLAASLARDQHAIRSGATRRGVAPDLVWLVAELAVSPYAHALERALFASTDETLCAALAAWDRGHCPACGSWPALAEIAASHRVLRCSFCAAAWEMNRYACTYCGEEGEKFVTAAPNEERMDRRLELCSACGGYLKTVDVPALSPFPLLAIADMETMDLDMAAMERGYVRPPLKEFGNRTNR
jgi:FdhE protein